MKCAATWKIIQAITINRKDSGRVRFLNLEANNIAAVAVMWPTLPPNQCNQLNIHRWEASG